ncbi:terpene synthase family protein (plasmid) [Streptomyces sp. NBC_01426]|uniref:terpene synthase family protein n=1 Tax=Streptomyces sp. NBC_01426 TaxID=2975866 RepID=UPI002E329875|nr:terpene synthase family protein [Streptomyces sp. NBC_01426]
MNARLAPLSQIPQGSKEGNGPAFFDGELTPGTPIALHFDAGTVAMNGQEAVLDYTAVCATYFGESAMPHPAAVEELVSACQAEMQVFSPEDDRYVAAASRMGAAWTAYAFPDVSPTSPLMATTALLNTGLFMHDDGVDPDPRAAPESVFERLRSLEEIDQVILDMFRDDRPPDPVSTARPYPHGAALLGCLREAAVRYAAHMPGWQSRKQVFVESLKEYLDAGEWALREYAETRVWPPDVNTFLFQREFEGAGNLAYEQAALLNAVDLPPSLQNLLEIKRFRQAATYAVLLGHDVMGLAKDIRNGNPSNLVMVLHQEGSLTLQEACDKVMAMQHHEAMETMRLAKALCRRHPDLTGYTRAVRLTVEGTFRAYAFAARYGPHGLRIRGIRTSPAGHTHAL